MCIFGFVLLIFRSTCAQAILTIRENHLYKNLKIHLYCSLCKRISRNSLVSTEPGILVDVCLGSECAFGRLNVFKADATLRPSRIDAPCERSSRHRALRNTRRRPAAWSPSGTPLGLDPGTSGRRREEWTSGRASHQLSLIGLIHGGEVKGHRRTASGGLEEGLYLHPRPPAILVWRRTLSSPDAQRHSSLPAQKLSKPQSGSLILDYHPVTQRRGWKN